MDITWPYKRRELGIHLYCNLLVNIKYGISKVMKSFTPVQIIMKHGLRNIQVNLTILLLLKLNLSSDQKVTCIWHRQSDTMMWWPQNLKECNRESKKLIVYINSLWSNYGILSLRHINIIPLKFSRMLSHLTKQPIRYIGILILLGIIFYDWENIPLALTDYMT